MAQNYGGFQVTAPRASAALVTVTNASGSVPGVWSDQFLTSTVSMPLVVAAGTSANFYFAVADTLTVSVKNAAVNGVEIATPTTNQPLTIAIGPGTFGKLDYTTVVPPFSYRSVWSPSDQGYLGVTDDPSRLSGGVALTLGVLFCSLIPLPAGGTVSNLEYVCSAGTALTSGQNWVGVYSSAGVLLGSSADQTTNFGSSSVRTAAITAASTGSLTLPVGSSAYAAFLSNASTTGVLIWRTGTSGTAGNLNQPTTQLRFGTTGSGLTTLPASFTVSGLASAQPYWAGLS